MGNCTKPNTKQKNSKRFNKCKSCDLQDVNRKISTIDKNPHALLYYLKSEIDIKQLKLRDENIERRVRQIIAKTYLNLISKEILGFAIERNTSLSPKMAKVFNRLKIALVIIGVIGAFSAPRIIDGLTSVEDSTVKIQEKSKYKFSGSIFNNGLISHSQGRGTCSWHDGVNSKFYKGDYSKTI